MIILLPTFGVLFLKTLRTEAQLNNVKSLHSSQKTRSVSITKTNQFILLGTMIGIYCEDRRTQANTGCGKMEYLLIQQAVPIPVATRSKARVCGRKVTAIAGSNPTAGMHVCLMWMLRVVRSDWSLIQRSPTETAVSSMWSCSIDKEQALAH